MVPRKIISFLHGVEWRYFLRKLYDFLIIIHLLIVMHGPTSQYFVFDFSYTDRVRHNSARISLFSKLSILCKFVFIFISGFTAFAFVFVFKCKSRKWLKGFPTVFIRNLDLPFGNKPRSVLPVTNSPRALSVPWRWFDQLKNPIRIH